MGSVRQVTCTQCYWCLWTEDWQRYEDDADCPRCGSPAVVGQRPDDVYPCDDSRRGQRFLRESDPHIAIAETNPDPV